MKVLCSEQKRLQKGRKHKIKQSLIIKCTVQIMGMATSYVFMAITILSLALFFHVEHSFKA